MKKQKKKIWREESMLKKTISKEEATHFFEKNAILYERNTLINDVITLEKACELFDNDMEKYFHENVGFGEEKKDLIALKDWNVIGGVIVLTLSGFYKIVRKNNEVVLELKSKNEDEIKEIINNNLDIFSDSYYFCLTKSLLNKARETSIEKVLKELEKIKKNKKIK